MRKKYLLLALLSSVAAQAQIVRKYSNEFLNIGAGARGLGMGGAVLTSQNDVYAPVWNPAGLASVESSWQAAAMHAEYFESIAKYDYISYAKPLSGSGGVLGISVIRLGVDNILNTTQLIDPQGNIDYDKISSFSQADYAALVSYAFRPGGNDALQAGVNAKIIYRNVGKFASGFGFGFDAGVQYQPESGWKYAAVLRDALTTVNFWNVKQNELSTVVNGQEFNPAPKDKMELTLPKLFVSAGKEFELPGRFTCGGEAGIQVDFGKSSALASASFASVSPFAGVEAGYDNTVFLRLGVNRFQNITDIESLKKKVTFQPSAGIGVRYKGIEVDYALSNSGPGGSDLFSNFFSLKIDMSKL